VIIDGGRSGWSSVRESDDDGCEARLHVVWNTTFPRPQLSTILRYESRRAWRVQE
jgi:hypothetical protein